MHSETLHSEQESAPLNNKRQDDKKESSKDENALEGIVNIESSRYGSKVPRKAAAKAQGRVAEFVKQMTTKFEYESSEAEGDVSDGSDDNYDVKNEAEVFALYKIANDGKRYDVPSIKILTNTYFSVDSALSVTFARKNFQAGMRLSLMWSLNIKKRYLQVKIVEELF